MYCLESISKTDGQTILLWISSNRSKFFNHLILSSKSPKDVQKNQLYLAVKIFFTVREQRYMDNQIVGSIICQFHTNILVQILNLQTFSHLYFPISDILGLGQDKLANTFLSGKYIFGNFIWKNLVLPFLGNLCS